MTDTTAPVEPFRVPKTALNATRAFWLKQLHPWHWISAAVSLIGLLLFAVTGIYWMNASVRGDPAGGQLAYSARYNSVVEVLP